MSKESEASSEFVETRPDVGNIEAGNSNSWRRKSRQTNFLIIFCSLIIILGLLPVLIVYLIVGLGGREIQTGNDGSQNRSVKLCGSHECNRNARIIRAKMNMTMDPCENFYEV